MKGLTIRQPWASLICHPDPLPAPLETKRVENRTWRTGYRGPLLVSAGEDRSTVQTAMFRGQRIINLAPDWCRLKNPHGVALGVVDVVDCIPVEDVALACERYPWLAGHPYVTGPWVWILANPRPLRVPVAQEGKLGLWDVHPLKIERVNAGLAGNS